MTNPTDRIFIRGLTLNAAIGVHAYEQPLRQRLVLDVEMAVDLAPSAASGRLEDTIDYKTVTETIQALVKDRRFALVETLAEAVARLILDDYGATSVRIAVAKPGAVRGVSDVGVIIERIRASR
ncbi:MAG: dihydroneopterin aldolase [Gammaproteobacteria bacterium]